MEKVASEAHRVLRPGGVLGWIIADEYRGGVYTPAGFRLLNLLERRFEPIDTIVLVRHHDRSASPMWEHRARRFNFFLRGFSFSSSCGNRLGNREVETLATALERTSDSSREIVRGLRNRLQLAAGRRDDRIKEHVSEHWISWRSRKGSRIFAEIRPLGGRVQIFLLPSPRELQDDSGLAKRAPPTQGWGWFRTRVEVRSIRQVAAAAALIHQSYLRGLEPNGRKPRRLKRRVPAS